MNRCAKHLILFTILAMGCQDDHADLKSTSPQEKQLYLSNAGEFSADDGKLTLRVQPSGQLEIFTQTERVSGRLKLFINGEIVETSDTLNLTHNLLEGRRDPQDMLVEVRMSDAPRGLGSICIDDQCEYSTGEHMLLMRQVGPYGPPTQLRDDCQANNKTCLQPKTLPVGLYTLPFYCPKGFKHQVVMKTTSGKTALSVHDAQGHPYGQSTSTTSTDRVDFYARSKTNQCMATISVEQAATVELEARAIKDDDPMTSLIKQAQPGDILLFATAPNQPCSLETSLNSIADVANLQLPSVMHYCHAALVLRNEPFEAIEAPGPKTHVRTFGPTDGPLAAVGDYYQSVTLLAVEADPFKKQRAVTHAEGQMGVPYGFVGDTLYCSELVNDAYAAGGIRLHKRGAPWVLPDDIALSQKVVHLFSASKATKKTATTTTTPLQNTPQLADGRIVLSYPFSTTEWRDIKGSPFHQCSDLYSRDYNSTKGAGNIELDRTKVDARLFAVFSGKVIFAGISAKDPGRGYQLIIESDDQPGLIASYAHLVAFTPEDWIGKRFRVGEELGVYVGNSGTVYSHLHFSLWSGVLDGDARRRVEQGQSPQGYSCDSSPHAVPYRFDLSAWAKNPCDLLPSGTYCADNGPHLALYTGDVNDLLHCKNGALTQTEQCPQNACSRRPPGENDQCGAPTNACDDPCPAQARLCSGDGFRVCEKNQSGCYQWTRIQRCPAGHQCTGEGQCTPNQTPCDHKCTLNQKRCTANNTYRVCQPDQNNCLVWSQTQSCAANTTCQQSTGQCEQAQCTPPTCQSAQAQCGTIPNPCGAPIQCGSCGQGYQCNNNTCTPDPVTPPSVQSVQTQHTQINETLNIQITGDHLVAGLYFELDDCSNKSLNVTSSTTAHATCTLGGAPGSRRLSIYDAQHTRLYRTTLTISDCSPQITSMTPQSVPLNASQTFQIRGTCLPQSGSVAWIAECVGQAINPQGSLPVSVNTQRTRGTFVCTPSYSKGSKAMVYKTKPSGLTLLNTTIQVY